METTFGVMAGIIIAEILIPHLKKVELPTLQDIKDKLGLTNKEDLSEKVEEKVLEEIVEEVTETVILL
jgi:hypothetical protein